MTIGKVPVKNISQWIKYEIISHDLKLYLNLFKEYLFSISYEIENYPYVQGHFFNVQHSHKTSYLLWFYKLASYSIYINRSRSIFRSLSLVLNDSGLKILP